MKASSIANHPYEMELTNGKMRKGFFIEVIDEKSNVGWGEVAPLVGYSKESLEDCIEQFEKIKPSLLRHNWRQETIFQDLKRLCLLPALLFGLESALLSLLSPLPEHDVLISALFMGSKEEIFEQAASKKKEGFRVAKVKISNLSMKDAEEVLFCLKDEFRLRVDVNQAWSVKQALEFFKRFKFDAFDYVEEPFQNPKELKLFTHPLAVDESFPFSLSLKEIEQIPNLKALIYKPTIQGGITNCLDLLQWTKEKKVSFILSSSFETDLGLCQIGFFAKRFSLFKEVGIGTYDFLTKRFCNASFQGAKIKLPQPLVVKKT